MQKDKRKENKKEIKKAGLALLSFFMLAGVVGTAISYGGNSNQMAVDNPLTNNIRENGVKVKLLKEETVGENFVYTYSFSVNPANATNQNVRATATYVDGTTYDNIVNVQVDNSAKTITLTTSTKTGFDKQIKVTISSESDPEVTAVMTLDFTKQVNNVDFEKTTYEVGYCFDQLISAEDYAIYDFSKYTIDEQYSVEFKSLSIASIETYETTGNPSDYEQGLVTFLQNSINNKTIITETLLWNAFDDNAWHSYLKSNADNADAYIQFALDEVIAEVKDSEGNVVLTTGNLVDLTDYYIELYIGYQYSSFTVSVDSITLESETVVFGK